MMQIDVKAGVILLITLLLGVVLGALGAGALARQRDDEMRQLRRPAGFVAHMDDIIRPRDDAQRATIQPLLQETANRNDSIIHGANESLRRALDSLRALLAPLLDQGQRARLDQAAKLAPPIGPPGSGRGEGEGQRRGGPPGGFPPPERGGPPPPRGGPPPDR